MHSNKSEIKSSCVVRHIDSNQESSAKFCEQQYGKYKRGLSIKAL